MKKLLIPVVLVIIIGCATNISPVNDVAGFENAGFVLLSITEKDVDFAGRRFPHLIARSKGKNSVSFIQSYVYGSDMTFMRKKNSTRSDYEDRYGSILLLKGKPGTYIISEIDVFVDGYRTWSYTGNNPFSFLIVEGSTVYIGNLDVVFTSTSPEYKIDQINLVSANFSDGSKIDYPLAIAKFPGLADIDIANASNEHSMFVAP